MSGTFKISKEELDAFIANCSSSYIWNSKPNYRTTLLNTTWKKPIRFLRPDEQLLGSIYVTESNQTAHVEESIGKAGSVWWPAFTLQEGL